MILLRFLLLIALLLSPHALHAQTITRGGDVHSDGTGTADCVAKFTGTSTIGCSQITDDGTLVGLNEGTPLAEFHMTRDQAALTELRIDNSDASGEMALQLFDGSNRRGLFRYDTGAALLTLGTDIATGQVSITSGSNVEALRIDASGDVTVVDDTAFFFGAGGNFFSNGNNVIDFRTGTTARIRFNSSVSFRLDNNLALEWSSGSPDSTGGDTSLSRGIAGRVDVTDYINLNPRSAAPSGVLGDIYVDSDLNLPCFHNGTNFVQMDDFSTTCS